PTPDERSALPRWESCISATISTCSDGKAAQSIVASAEFAGPPAWDFHPAFGSFGGKREFDDTTKLKWNEFANYSRSIARLVGGSNRRAVDFLPFDDELVG